MRLVAFSDQTKKKKKDFILNENIYLRRNHNHFEQQSGQNKHFKCMDFDGAQALHCSHHTELMATNI